MLTIGDRGEHVRNISGILVSGGFLDAETDMFDNNLRSAVIEFQSQNLDSIGEPLLPDGKVGPLTMWALTNIGKDMSNFWRDLFKRKYDPAIKIPASADAPIGHKAAAIAIKEMNKGAGEEGDDNCGPWVEKYINDMCKIHPTSSLWCAGFVSWCFQKASGNEAMPFKYTIGAKGFCCKLCRPV